MFKRAAAIACSVLLLGATGFDALNTDFKSVGILLKYEVEGIRVSDAAVPNTIFLSLPVSHRRTGILSRDVHFVKNGKIGSLFAKAGSSAYSFAEFSDGRTQTMSTWCFADAPQVPSPKIKCLVDQSGGKGESWAEGLVPSNKYMPIWFEKGVGANTEIPIVALGPSKVHPDLRMECTFLKWGNTFADIRCLLGGQSIGLPGTFLRLDRATDGTLAFDTPAGRLRLTPQGSGATVKIIAPPPQAPR